MHTPAGSLQSLVWLPFSCRGAEHYTSCSLTTTFGRSLCIPFRKAQNYPYSILTHVKGLICRTAPKVQNQLYQQKRMAEAPGQSCVRVLRPDPNHQQTQAQTLVLWRHHFFSCRFSFFHSLYRHYMKQKCLLDQITTSL